MAKHVAKSQRPFLIAVCLCLSVIILVAIAIVVWKTTSDDNDDGDVRKASFDISLSYAINAHNITLALRRATATDRVSLPPVSLAVGVSTRGVRTTDAWSSSSSSSSASGAVSFKWPDGTTVNISKSRNDRFLSCLTVNWTMPRLAKETVVDCLDTSASLWYGGFEESYQHWPINGLSIPMRPFITGDAYFKLQIGNIVEPLLVSSLGFGIYVDEAVPLYVSFNHEKPGHLCLKGKAGEDSPFFDDDSTVTLYYHLCGSTDITRLWKEMARVFISKPTDIPSLSLFRNPIWSTWAMYKGAINQSKALNFADDILNKGYGISQLEIDDNWTPKYGDMTFDLKKFPEAEAMIRNLANKGIPVTVWLHPFFNNDSSAFKELSDSGFLVKDGRGRSPALTHWWRGEHAGILDVTNPRAVEWYLNKTAHLKSHFNVTSFKFDAGEVSWLPGEYSFHNKMLNLNFFTHFYIKMAYQSDTKHRRQETRVGFKTQELPILVRMIDRDSVWSHENGLKSLIPTALTFSLMGYHFILPDMIGGNAYDPDDLDKTVLPDVELFVRWLQVTTFMPVLQFSVAPWLYNDTVVNISSKFVKLHESFADTIVALARHSVATGEPIIRPLWWTAPDDPDSLGMDSEFLLGDAILVAPVVEKGARSRDVYLPRGQWRSAVTDVVFTGPIWLKDFVAPLDVLPYFFKV